MLKEWEALEEEDKAAWRIWMEADIRATTERLSTLDVNTPTAQQYKE